jgi:hypothetical protein
MNSCGQAVIDLRFFKLFRSACPEVFFSLRCAARQRAIRKIFLAKNGVFIALQTSCVL